MVESNKIRCLYCGNNPTNHTRSFVMQTFSVLFAPALRVGSVVDRPAIRTIIKTIMTPYLWMFRALGFLQLNKDPNRAFTERSEVIWIEAQKRGILMEQFVIWGKAVEHYRAKINKRWHYFESLPIPPWLPQYSYSWMDDKWLLKKKFLEKGIPVPAGAHVTSHKQAQKVFKQMRKPVIVKPELGSRGRHTTTFIYTPEELTAAFNIAHQLGAFVVIEEMLFGSVYRATYVGGKIVGILRGDPARITGDGILSISELIEKKNKEKDLRVKDVVVTKKTQDFLQRQGLALDSILEREKTIDLSEKIGISYGGFAAEEITKTHPKTLEILKCAGDILSAPVIGFDFIIPNIEADPDTQAWGIIEANSLPFINLHHFPLEGEPINVAAKVWDLWKK